MSSKTPTGAPSFVIWLIVEALRATMDNCPHLDSEEREGISGKEL